jgi:predicted signal transduction protein with EAL and GGDEF domain
MAVTCVSVSPRCPSTTTNLNLGLADVAVLVGVLDRALARKDFTLLDEYGSRALQRVWRAQHFSHRLTGLLHLDTAGTGFDSRRQLGELAGLVSSAHGSAYLAEGYTGSAFPAREDSRSVNLSPLQLRQPALAVHMLDLIRCAEVDPATVCLEITERGAVHAAEARTFVTTLREACVHFALDDFGTSHSTLSHLRQLPVECLKIDRSFVAGLTRPGDQQVIDRGLIQAVLAIGVSLELNVIAEGIETPEQRATLASLGC